MKVSTAILLLSSLYIASALSNTPWTLVRQGSNSAWTEGLDGFGGQNNLGQAFDSGLFNGTNGEVTNTYNSWFQSAANAPFNYSSDLQLTLEDDSTHNSKYALSIDPETGRRSIIWWSLQLLTGDNNGPAGRNITYDKDTDTVTVTSFEGLDQWALYQQGRTGSNANNGSEAVVDADDDNNVVVDPSEETEVIVDGPGETNVVVDPSENTEVVVDGNEETDVIVDDGNNSNNNSDLNVQTYSFRDYLHNFIGYEEGDTETFMNDEGLNNAVNNAVFAVGDAAGLDNIILDELHTLDTYVDEVEDLWVRVNADVTSDTDSGEITAVYWCSGGSNCDGDDGALRYWWWNSRLYA